MRPELERIGKRAVVLGVGSAQHSVFKGRLERDGILRKLQSQRVALNIARGRRKPLRTVDERALHVAASAGDVKMYGNRERIRDCCCSVPSPGDGLRPAAGRVRAKRAKHDREDAWMA